MDKAPAPSGAIEFHYELQRCDDIECCAALFRKQARPSMRITTGSE